MKEINSVEFPVKTYIGKAKDVFSMSRFQSGRSSVMFLVATDRISAFDQSLDGQEIPYKGQVITAMSEFWFKTLKDIVPNHFIDRVGTNTLAVKPCEIIPVEVIVRSRIVGSLWKLYTSGQREIYGHQFQDGLQKGDLLEKPIITPTTKAVIGDEPLSLDDPISMGLVSKRDWEYIKEVSLALFNEARKMVAKYSGLRLIDWKLEFGISNNEIILADEIGTPDSSRFLLKGNHLDKELVRAYLIDTGVEDRTIQLPSEFIAKVSQAYQLAMSLITSKLVVPYSKKQIQYDIIDYLEDT